ncbi:MAG: hypothetical protein A2V74_04855 [Acidobacteria bacterium RBG_16_70_10]|nr:MAG: hypothetical protein A2V74_04855 [Acidobacteria bacterium RBG_16_70_10]
MPTIPPLVRALVLGLSAVPAAEAQAPAIPGATSPVAFPGQYAPTPAEWKYPVWPTGCARFEGDKRVACLEFVSFDFGRLSRFDDGLHPNAAGCAVMAPLAEEAIAQALGAGR